MNKKVKRFFENVWYYVYTKGIRRIIPKYHNRTIFTRFFWRTLKDRLIKGYDESELWDLDAAFTRLIAPRMRDFTADFERSGIGVPSWIVEEEYKEAMRKGFAFDKHYHRLESKKETDRCYKRAQARWLSILREITDGFSDMELRNKDYEKWISKWAPVVQKWQKKINGARSINRREEIWNQIGTWRSYREGIIVMEEDVTHYLHQRAIELLSLHYHSLWS